MLISRIVKQRQQKTCAEGQNADEVFSKIWMQALGGYGRDMEEFRKNIPYFILSLQEERKPAEAAEPPVHPKSEAKAEKKQVECTPQKECAPQKECTSPKECTPQKECTSPKECTPQKNIPQRQEPVSKKRPDKKDFVRGLLPVEEAEAEAEAEAEVEPKAEAEVKADVHDAPELFQDKPEPTLPESIEEDLEDIEESGEEDETDPGYEENWIEEKAQEGSVGKVQISASTPPEKIFSIAYDGLISLDNLVKGFSKDPSVQDRDLSRERDHNKSKRRRNHDKRKRKK